ncbi:MAG: DUF3857 domain-containing protein [Chitinophagaceae bacterium]|jgi:hypothetical protein|nr:DUF3857 domain-containing protein [Chitinophagaceae bacterium]
MKVKLFASLLVSLFFILPIFSQESSAVKFGKISPDDFKTTIYSIDSGAAAVIIADKGSTEIVGNSKGWFSLEFKHFKRIHILNKNGYDAADIQVLLFANDGLEEELQGLKAVTYNLENNKVAETKLDKKAVFTDKRSKKLVVKKFTLPNIKEGSIIEFEYTVKSDFLFNLQPWEFQGEYPRLWSEYVVRMPEFMGYIFLSQGYHPYHIKDNKNKLQTFSIMDNSGTTRTEHYSLNANVTDFRWVMKDVSALKEESFTSTLNNHIAKIEFQLSDYRYPLTPKKIMGSWEQASGELLKSENFGANLSKDNGWLGDVVKEATKGATNDLDKAKKIYAFVRDNMTCTNYGRLYLEKTLKNILKDKSGNEAELNLLLTAILIRAGFTVDPVLLSTRSHGYAYELYPLMDKFNYVISRLDLGGKHYFLDASQPRLGFGKLGYESYNGHARVINVAASPLDFKADSLIEGKMTSVFIVNNDKGKLIGKMQQVPGFYESFNMRNNIKENGKDKLFSDIKKEFNAEIEILDSKIDSLDQYDHPLGINYDFQFTTDNEDILYFNPMFSEAWKENPFKSADRFYPVEMPYTIDETYILRIDIPNGYEVDELPKQIMVKLNEDDDGSFEYRLSNSKGAISLRSRIRLSRAFFHPEEYDTLREFFNLVVKKHSEQIVFKRKANP